MEIKSTHNNTNEHFTILPTNLVFEHSFTICLFVCSVPQEQRGDCSNPHLYSKLSHLPCSVLTLFRIDHNFRERLNPWTPVSGFSIIVTPCTPESFQNLFHNSNDTLTGNVKSYIGRLDLSLLLGCVTKSSFSGMLGSYFYLVHGVFYMHQSTQIQ